MYILYKTEPRAETTDTLILMAAADRNALEEILLALYNELYDRELEWAYRENYETWYHPEALHSYCRDRMKCYGIVWVPYLDN